MIILTIITACIILYKVGAVGRFLKRCELTPEPMPPAPPEKPPALSDREQIEIDARYIIARQGYNPDTVAYMSDGLLQAIIIDFKNEIKKGGK